MSSSQLFILENPLCKIQRRMHRSGEGWGASRALCRQRDRLAGLCSSPGTDTPGCECLPWQQGSRGRAPGSRSRLLALRLRGWVKDRRIVRYRW